MTRILCFGNPWQGDDGFGIHVYRRLRNAPPRENTQDRLFEVGLRGLDALPLFDGCKTVILVDALRDAEFPAGTVRILSADDIAHDDAPHGAGACGHGLGVNFLLRALAATHPDPPEVTLIGAVADRIVPFTETLSPALRNAMEPVLDEILRRVAAAGARLGNG